MASHCSLRVKVSILRLIKTPRIAKLRITLIVELHTRSEKVSRGYTSARYRLTSPMRAYDTLLASKELCLATCVANQVAKSLLSRYSSPSWRRVSQLPTSIVLLVTRNVGEVIRLAKLT